MAQVSLSTAYLVEGSTGTGVASVAITAGQLVGKYADTDNNLGPCDATNPDRFIPVGLSLVDANAGDIVVYARNGSKIDSPEWVNTTWGTNWWVSNVAGQICNYSDLNNGDNMYKVGYVFEYENGCILDFVNMLATKTSTLPTEP